MDITTQYILWSASIYAVMELLKKIPNLPKRIIPLLPPLIGILSGFFIAPHVFGVPGGIGAFYGVGASGVSALSYSILKKTIQGRD